jgi:hypothetical protein
MTRFHICGIHSQRRGTCEHEGGGKHCRGGDTIHEFLRPCGRLKQGPRTLADYESCRIAAAGHSLGSGYNGGYLSFPYTNCFFVIARSSS